MFASGGHHLFCTKQVAFIIRDGRSHTSTHCCSYDLYEAEKADSDGDTVMKMFGRVNVPFWTAMFTWAYPILDATGHSPASIERIFGAGVQVRTFYRPQCA